MQIDFRRFLGQLKRNERGASAIEYGVLASGVGMAALASVFVLGTDVAAVFGGVSGSFHGGRDGLQAPLIRPLANGSFDFAMSPGTQTTQALSGWTNAANRGRVEIWGDGFMGVASSEGRSFIELDAGRDGIDHIESTVDMAAGATYTLRFDHAARAGGGAQDDVEITHNGTVVTTVAPRSIGSWVTAEVELVGMDGDDRIGFRELDGQNDSYGVLLDNVRIE